MNTALQAQVKAATKSAYSPSYAGLLQRKCACGGAPGIAGECEECSRKQLTTQRAPLQRADSSSAASSIPTEALGQSGSPAELRIRALMQSRLGHVFGRLGSHAAAPERMQTKLTVGRPGDEYEEEAERVAEQVMRMPEEAREQYSPQPTSVEQVMRMPAGGAATVDDEAVLEVVKIICPDCENEAVQAKASSAQLAPLNPGLEAQIETMKGGGQPLPESVRAFFEPRFGHDFSNVRIHTDSAAAETAEQLHALAYTVGTHIAFGPGQYAPDSAAGKRLLAHELTHVVQQNPQAQRAERQISAFPERGPATAARAYSKPARIRGGTPIRISKQTSPEQIRLHTKADCDEEYEVCCDGCRRLPPNAKRRRALCWAACMAAYAACLASSEEALTFAAIVAAIVLVAADGPFPIGDAAAAALLISLGITGASR